MEDTHGPDKAPQGARQSVMPVRAGSNLLSVCGWVLGAVSLLNLIQDIGWVSVYGKLKAWIYAYDLFVRNVGGFLFGWIDLWIFRVSDSELHTLVIAGVVASGIARAQYKWGRYFGPVESPLEATLAASLIVLLPPLALAIVIPDPYGAFAAIAVLLAVCGATWGLAIIGTYDDIDPLGFLPSPSDLGRELIGVIAVFVVLLAVNYTVFRTEGA